MIPALWTIQDVKVAIWFFLLFILIFIIMSLAISALTDEDGEE